MSLEQAIEEEVARRVAERLAETDVAPRVYTVNEAAAAMHVSRSTVYKMLADGEIQKAPLTRRVLIPADQVSRQLGVPA
ncbi:helix-turn-helix domain-containing protein [Mycolicibacterium fortuitum]|uniref:helix-turn-helix domain-containing protein n=1 Tax=Mycolicibacterium fortuitum TaxID=1766 RepID=UPI001CDC567F|nr:helix-turn-helix domain-containing protein [Mycolicibacterium fortuitum]UBV15001.1 helix-turn-helix domain-containing protein [Mycolicibacterium fortuitum]